VPPGAINWNDFDDNNAFHAKQIVMDIEARCRPRSPSSKKAAGLQRHRRDGPGAQQRRQAGAGPARKPLRPDPKGAKNVAVAKDFLKYLDPCRRS